MTFSSSTPAGTLTEMRRFCFWRPEPRQSGQGSVMMVPSPWHCPQTEVLMNWPKMLRCTRRTWPEPPQVGQRSGLLPGRERVPWQVAQTSVRVMSISFSVPRAASSKVTVIL